VPKHPVQAGAATKQQQTIHGEQPRWGTQGRGSVGGGRSPLDFGEFGHAATEE